MKSDLGWKIGPPKLEKFGFLEYFSPLSWGSNFQKISRSARGRSAKASLRTKGSPRPPEGGTREAPSPSSSPRCFRIVQNCYASAAAQPSLPAQMVEDSLKKHT